MSGEPIGYDEATIRALEEENKELLAENRRLRAALARIAASTYGYEPNSMSDEEAVEYFSNLFFNAQQIARSALSPPPARQHGR